jgi:xanthine dehydrogenase accessory factor
MENLDVMVLRTLRDWRRSGRRAALATVVRTWGSSPRPVGSIMALADFGAVVGSVSGGCIEDDLIHRYGPREGAESAMPVSGPRLVKYGVSADEAHRFGLPCGGTLELLLEFNPDHRELEALVEGLERGLLMRRTVNLANGGAVVEECRRPEPLRLDAREMVSTFGPEYRMLLIGAGQLAEYLATMATFSGFAVTVCDPREEYRTLWSVQGVTVTTEMPDDAVTAFRADSRSCVIALSHDPKLDDLALLEALCTPAFYVGAIGSRRNAKSRHQRMREHFDITEAQLARLRGPIGIFIGSKTPPEIAVSIMAEVVACKNGVNLAPTADVATAKEMAERCPALA